MRSTRAAASDACETVQRKKTMPAGRPQRAQRLQLFSGSSPPPGPRRPQSFRWVRRKTWPFWAAQQLPMLARRPSPGMWRSAAREYLLPFPPGTIVAGSQYIGPGLANNAHAVAATAYGQLAGETLTTDLSRQDLGTLPMTLTPRGLPFRYCRCVERNAHSGHRRRPKRRPPFSDRHHPDDGRRLRDHVAQWQFG